jgi:hypothetical protein
LKEKENKEISKVDNKNTLMLWSMDPEKSLLLRHPTVRQTTDLAWPRSDATSLKGELASEMPLHAEITPSCS